MVNIYKIHSNIFEITQSNFIKSLSDQYKDIITDKLSNFPSSYNILFTNSNIQHITNYVADVSQHIIIRLKFDII